MPLVPVSGLLSGPHPRNKLEEFAAERRQQHAASIEEPNGIPKMSEPMAERLRWSRRPQCRNFFGASATLEAV